MLLFSLTLCTTCISLFFIDRPVRFAPSVFSITFHNFQGISDLFSEVSWFNHRTKQCCKRNISYPLISASSGVLPAVLLKVMGYDVVLLDKFFFIYNAPTCPYGLRGPHSWAWQECNRLLRLGRQ